MSSIQSFIKFVERSKTEIGAVDSENMDSVRMLIRMAIETYNMKTKVVEEKGNECQRVETLYLASISEENMLMRIAELALGSSDNARMEIVFSSNVVRSY
ncbi:DUF6407 family protein [Evansella tamaricis]|uniref:Uncharacterized protein n=1 Tax=Evansella tamaricis TaxID=2069301 RepID=A0ABS6JGP3_9BACI|nr:DUF6407 family protein [Evansella tamaricis]MBU9712813.1 hypothetical protein [Evansella tamaricis]